jgi:serine/threonine protein phosphatase PrpC
MQLRGAVASHVGNVRETNQDRAHFGGYLAAVADGMGGHQGGEMAASIAINEFLDVVDPIGPGGLVEIVEEANRAVFERAADPDLRGMGTTLVAITLRPRDEKVSVVNVGDSRAYFLRGGELRQLTNDHSLVEDLVRQNRLTPEEALTHPQRNILTRALGIGSEVEVDRFLEEVELGDRFLLCSDGLFNEVTEAEIVEILVDCPQPNDAADGLIAAALSRAARDNVTVAVVDVVADGQGGDVSTHPPEALTIPPPRASDEITKEAPIVVDSGDGDQSHPGPGPGTAPGPDVTATLSPERMVDLVPDHDGGPDGAGYEDDVDFGRGATSALDLEETVPRALAARGAASSAVEAEGPVTAPLPSGNVGVDVAVDPEVVVEPAEAADEAHIGNIDTIELPVTEERRGSRLRQVLFGLVVLIVLAAVAYLGGTLYARSGWFVDHDPATGGVAIYHGRPGLPLLSPELVEGFPDKPYDQLDAESQQQVDERQVVGSRDEAEAIVDGLVVDGEVSSEDLEDLEEEVDDATVSATTTTAAAATTTTVATPPEADSGATAGSDAAGSDAAGSDAAGSDAGAPAGVPVASSEATSTATGG